MTKRFGGVPALDRVDFEARPGEVTGVIGAGGAGKSTLCAVLTGRVRPDEGEVRVTGPSVLIQGEPALAAEATVAENLWLGAEPRRAFGLVDRAEMTRRARIVLARLGSRLDPGAPAGGLPLEQQRIVEMARALAVGAELVVLDDPAAAVPSARIGELLAAVRRLAATGVTVVYATPRSCELAQVADRATVLRSGRGFGPYPADDALDLAASAFARESTPSTAEGRPLDGVVLDVRGLRAGRLVEDVSFGVRSGEIVALVGPGADEVVASLAGSAVVRSGRILVHGEPLRPRRPSDAARAGIGYLAGSADLLATGSVGGNIAVAQPHLGWLGRSRSRRVVSMAAKLLRTGLPAADRMVATLPAAERHRVALARMLMAEYEILLLAEPVATDHGAHKAIRELADAGTAIVVAFGVVTDALAVADRVVLLRNGRSVGEAEVPGLSTQDVIRWSAGIPCAS
ncbi:ATP-binding cassette domain-containing protein [Actinocrispum sp. NPDC049592]|uniref:ATP-binding cassette domain-containing protein n=1 Tax=Actinocrispum sp. NPDC049592 TaxID=3154835 RepID=UPI003437E1EC